jgi:Protein of unknown function (DUF938)
MSDTPKTLTLPVFPSAERNKGPILDVLRTVLPATGRVLEVASGSGQHVVHFAAALPALVFQPTEPDLERVEIIRERVRQSGCPNVLDPLRLDVHDRPWLPDGLDGVVAVLAINMIHIAPWSATAALFAGAAAQMASGVAGLVVLYGAFKVDGVHTADSNVAFDAWLRTENASWGVRDLGDVTAVAHVYGFSGPDVVQMPSNNLCVIYRLVTKVRAW